MTKVSVITISYNNAEGLRRTIESVVAQNYSDYEYIIIDGGSTDNSLQIIESYASHISYWVSEPDKGRLMQKGIHKHIIKSYIPVAEILPAFGSIPVITNLNTS